MWWAGRELGILLSLPEIWAELSCIQARDYAEYRAAAYYQTVSTILTASHCTPSSGFSWRSSGYDERRTT